MSSSTNSRISKYHLKLRLTFNFPNQALQMYTFMETRQSWNHFKWLHRGNQALIRPLTSLPHEEFQKGEKECEYGIEYLAGSCRAECPHVCSTRNYVDSESNKQGTHSGIDGAKEWKCNGKKPDWEHHWHTTNCPKQQALCLVHSNQFLPHEKEWCNCKSNRNELHKSSQFTWVNPWIKSPWKV